MKKIALFGVCLLLGFTAILPLCGCGKSEKVKKVEALISSIGEVTIDDKQTIQSAQEAYDLLSETEKQSVSNYVVLISALRKLQELQELEQESLTDISGTWIGTLSVYTLTYVFNKDGTYESFTDYQSAAGTKGTYSFDGETLVLRNSDGSVDRIKAKKTSETILILSTSTSSSTIDIVFKKQG